MQAWKIQNFTLMQNFRKFWLIIESKASCWIVPGCEVQAENKMVDPETSFRSPSVQNQVNIVAWIRLGKSGLGNQTTCLLARCFEVPACHQHQDEVSRNVPWRQNSRVHMKHCQRHNRDWVFSPKWLVLSNIKVQVQNLYQTSASKSWSNSGSNPDLNSASKSLQYSPSIF